MGSKKQLIVVGDRVLINPDDSKEKTNFGLRSFIGIPLQTTEKVYGALTLEHIVPGKFTEDDKHRIQQITDIFSSTFLRQQS